MVGPHAKWPSLEPGGGHPWNLGAGERQKFRVQSNAPTLLLSRSLLPRGKSSLRSMPFSRQLLLQCFLSLSFFP